MSIEAKSSFEELQNLDQNTNLSEKLDYLKVDGLNEEHFNQFIQAIENKKGIDYYEDLVEVLLDIDNQLYVKEILISYINNEGYPINNALNKLLKEFFDIDVSKEEMEKYKEKMKEDKENNNIKKNKEIKLFDKKKEENLEEKEKFKENAPKFIDENRDKLNRFDLGKKFISILEEANYEEASEFLENNYQKLFQLIAKSGDKEFFESTKKFISDSFPIFEIKSFDFYRGETYVSTSAGTEKIISSIESQNSGLLKIDLNHLPPKSKLSLLDSKYSFDKAIDSEEIREASGEYIESKGASDKSLRSLDTFTKGFENLLTNISSVWGEEDFKEALDTYVTTFRMHNLQKLEKIYDMIPNIPKDLLISSADISDLKNISHPNDLKFKIENIQNKLQKLGEYIREFSIGAYKKYEEKLKNTVDLDKQTQEKQLKTLSLIHSLGFDLIDQSTSKDLINQLNIERPYGMNDDIDLEAGKIGFVDGNDTGLPVDNTFNQKRFGKLVNILLSGSEDRPVNLDSIGSTGSINYVGLDGKVVNNYNEINSQIRGSIGANHRASINENRSNYDQNKNNI